MPPTLWRQAPFGDATRNDFFIDFETYTFVNHGAFGACLRTCYEVSHAWQAHCEAQPLRFIDRELFPHMVALLRDMAEFINARPDELAFIPNATTGLNIVLANVTLQQDDEVLMLDIGYGSLKKIATAACRACGAMLVQAHVELPVRHARGCATARVEFRA